MTNTEELYNYTAIYAGKRVDFQETTLYRAKLEAISRLRVPKAKQGLLSVFLNNNDTIQEITS